MRERRAVGAADELKPALATGARAALVLPHRPAADAARDRQATGRRHVLTISTAGQPQVRAPTASASGGYWGCGMAMTRKPAAAAERRPLEESSTAAQSGGEQPSLAATAR